MPNQIYIFWLSHHYNYPTIIIVSLLSYLNPIYYTFWLSHHYNSLTSMIVSLFPHQNQILNTFWLSHHYHCLTHPNSTPNKNGFWLAQHYDCHTLTLCQIKFIIHSDCLNIVIVPPLWLSHSYPTKTKYVIHSGCHTIMIVSP